ncbi:hypothetical protein C5C31_11700 [Rathayibacter rathayi]|uniref:DUF222 domain-containing protein n=1 Tax=Rathayibacter rathayi TaxID=33887 RepID=A0ABX5AGL2_RATRA|nr:hypothetical protein [Rathayibacter rathayi]MWV75927.1 hypothetical protein [Rathayibacter rathayi NCPPB 2980 = VKM Ac-1601]PPG66034.1 hypothetical protein C5C16_12010 [Rathayibacter rathayi]PPG66523.1 hypothetical protein C5C02_11240 [Rathayibacter rathayi]PPG74891.1 hypothetical protein C5C23_11815 [Rathayibacter rathayi]PPG75141.1 hypothetical protein C5C15_13395 [Rathayibacter rathayi]
MSDQQTPQDWPLDASTIEIDRPERYWVAAREDMPWLTDPDIDDRGCRHPDRDDVDWTAVAAAATSISSLLRAGQLDASDGEGSGFVATVPGLTLRLRELEILESLFTVAEAIRGDLWDEGVVNGRHRLWNIWRAAPDALIPVRSDLLDHTDDIDSQGDTFAAVVTDSTRTAMRQLTAEVGQRAPLFTAALRAAAGGDVDGSEVAG